MTDEELKRRFDELSRKIDETKSEAADKGHFFIIILLIAIAAAVKAS